MNEAIKMKRHIADETFTVEVPAFLDEESGELVATLAMAEAADLAIAQRLVWRDACSPDAFSFTRRALGLKAVDLARELDRAPETISRWENGALSIDRGAWLYLGDRLLDRIGCSRSDIIARRLGSGTVRPLSDAVLATAQLSEAELLEIAAMSQLGQVKEAERMYELLRGVSTLAPRAAYWMRYSPRMAWAYRVIAAAGPEAAKRARTDALRHRKGSRVRTA